APGESSFQWALRLDHNSRFRSEDLPLRMVQDLQQQLSSQPQSRAQVLEMLNSLRSIGSCQTPGGLMAESHVVPGLEEPMVALRIPKLYPVEPWPASFIDSLLADLKAGPPMEGIVQLDSRTGWLTTALAKMGLARRILGVDAQPQSQILGNFHAALHEGGGRVEFRDEAQWPSLPKDWQADLILASPGNGYSPSPSDLNLIELRISQARERLREGG